MKGLIVIFCLLVSMSAFSQTNSSVDTNYNYISLDSRIVDHSDVQKYIDMHELIEKKKDFVNGYRIQIFTSPDRENAQKTKSEFYSRFSGIRCYLTYQQPYYRIRVGNYETQQDAREDLKKMARYYPSSFLVPDIVTTSNKDED